MALGDYDLVVYGFGSFLVAIIWFWVVLGACGSFWWFRVLVSTN